MSIEVKIGIFAILALALIVGCVVDHIIAVRFEERMRQSGRGGR